MIEKSFSALHVSCKDNKTFILGMVQDFRRTKHASQGVRGPRGEGAGPVPGVTRTQGGVLFCPCKETNRKMIKHQIQVTFFFLTHFDGVKRLVNNRIHSVDVDRGGSLPSGRRLHTRVRGHGARGPRWASETRTRPPAGGSAGRGGQAPGLRLRGTGRRSAFIRLRRPVGDCQVVGKSN